MKIWSIKSSHTLSNWCPSSHIFTKQIFDFSFNKNDFIRKAKLNDKPVPPFHIFMTLKHTHRCQVNDDDSCWAWPLFKMSTKMLITHKWWNEICWGAVNNQEHWTRLTWSHNLFWFDLKNYNLQLLFFLLEIKSSIKDIIKYQ